MPVWPSPVWPSPGGVRAESGVAEAIVAEPSVTDASAEPARFPRLPAPLVVRAMHLLWWRVEIVCCTDGHGRSLPSDGRLSGSPASAKRSARPKVGGLRYGRRGR